MELLELVICGEFLVFYIIIKTFNNQLLFIGIAPINKPKGSCTTELKKLAKKFSVLFKEELRNEEEIVFERFKNEM